MKKIQFKHLDFNTDEVLNREEMKTILGGLRPASGLDSGSGDDDGPCCVSNNHGPWDCGYSVNQAQNLYNQQFTVGDSTVTGYCCASCP